MFLVLLWVSWILPGGIDSLFDHIIEVMHEEIDNIIRFSEQPSPWRFNVKLRDIECSFIAGVAAPINGIGKQPFRNTLLDTIFYRIAVVSLSMFLQQNSANICRAP